MDKRTTKENIFFPFFLFVFLSKDCEALLLQVKCKHSCCYSFFIKNQQWRQLRLTKNKKSKKKKSKHQLKDKYNVRR